MTHREYTLAMRAQAERFHDENEREAMYATMYAAAYRGKGRNGKPFKAHELYKRPNGDEVYADPEEEMADIQKRNAEFLAQLDLSKLNKKT